MGGKGSGGAHRKPVTYYRDEGFIYRILFIGLGGEVLHQEDAKFGSRTEAKEYAEDFARDTNLQYHKLSIQRQQRYLTYTNRLKSIDPSLIKEQRRYNRYTVQLNDESYNRMRKIEKATGLNRKHYARVVRDEINRLYEMYFDEDGNLKQLR